MQAPPSHVRTRFWLHRAIPPLVMMLAVVAIQSGAGDSANAETRQTTPLVIETDKAQLIQLPEPAKTVFVANPDIANVQVPTSTTFLVYGRKPGTTTVFAISETGNAISYSVRVTRPSGEIAAAVHGAVPGARVGVSATPEGVTISGTVNSPRDAERIKAAAKQFVGDKEAVNFNVGITGGTQVTLRVRVAEVSRNISKQLGVNWSALATIGTLSANPVFPALGLIANASPTVPIPNGRNPLNLGGNFNAVIDALNTEGLATILAEPYLTALSGETANFLAGGEYPIPVPQGVQIVTIEYKRFGVSVDFTPTVLDDGRISIKVRPEVSQLTTVGQLTLNGVSVPALTVRRAETTVELGSGESFVIAGLYQNNSSNQMQGLPALGDIPILGALFRSTSFQRNESELVIIVTPYIVRPVSRSADLRLPTEGLRYSSDIERILLGRLTARSAASPIRSPNEPRLRGAAGFMLE
jgi:pilus assembly protein CpaC